ncbi:MPP4 protein, partial [Polypterus senegalus]
MSDQSVDSGGQLLLPDGWDYTCATVSLSLEGDDCPIRTQTGQQAACSFFGGLSALSQGGSCTLLGVSFPQDASMGAAVHWSSWSVPNPGHGGGGGPSVSQPRHKWGSPALQPAQCPLASVLAQGNLTLMNTVCPFRSPAGPLTVRLSPVQVYECLQLQRTMRPPAVLNAALPLTREALLLAHDMVAQKDYEPVLPPLPCNLPEDEEAMRIVCLVKNKQPLTLKRRWRDLKKKTKQKMGVSKKLPVVDGVPSCNYGPRQQGVSLQGAGVDTSDGILPADDTSAVDEDYGPCGHSDVRRAPCPPSVPTLAYESPSCGRRCWPVDLQQGAGRLRASSLPLSLEDLQSTTSSVASTAERTPCDMKLLGQKVLSATEMMAENIQENTQALRLLVDVLERMQGLLLESEPAPSSTAPMGTVPPQAGSQDEERSAGMEQLANGLTTPSPEEWQASDLLTDTNM